MAEKGLCSEGVLLGAVIGDIAGSTYEFDNVDPRTVSLADFDLFPRGSEITDDTVMTVAVAEALRRTDGSHEDLRRIDTALRQSMIKWYEKYPAVSYGSGFRIWLAEGAVTTKSSWGNGAPMRCSAAGWLAHSLAEAADLAVLTVLPSHLHPASIRAAQCVASLI